MYIFNDKESDELNKFCKENNLTTKKYFYRCHYAENDYTDDWFYESNKNYEIIDALHVEFIDKCKEIGEPGTSAFEEIATFESFAKFLTGKNIRFKKMEEHFQLYFE